MSKNVGGDADARRKAAREAHREGASPSEVGATTGAAKQIKHLTLGAERSTSQPPTG